MAGKIRKGTDDRVRARARRRKHIRKTVIGTPERPRLCIFRSNKHMYAQIIDDTTGRTLAAVSTLSQGVRELLEDKDKKGGATVVGTEIAKKCLEKEIKQIVFDRSGYLYDGGRVKALAEAARKAGLVF